MPEALRQLVVELKAEPEAEGHQAEQRHGRGQVREAGQTLRLLEFIGLDWDETCLRFYEAERLVRTASVTQVRQPVYTRSVERWRRYEEKLAPLLERIGG